MCFLEICILVGIRTVHYLCIDNNCCPFDFGCSVDRLSISTPFAKRGCETLFYVVQ